MIYIATSNRKEIAEDIALEADVSLHIKVPSRGLDDQPLLGFASQKLAKEYLEYKNIPTDEYSVLPLDEAISDEYKSKPVLVFENWEQIENVDRNPERYDYEKLIYENDL